MSMLIEVKGRNDLLYYQDKLIRQELDHKDEVLFIDKLQSNEPSEHSTDIIEGLLAKENEQVKTAQSPRNNAS